MFNVGKTIIDHPFGNGQHTTYQCVAFTGSHFRLRFESGFPRSNALFSGVNAILWDLKKNGFNGNFVGFNWIFIGFDALLTEFHRIVTRINGLL